MESLIRERLQDSVKAGVGVNVCSASAQTFETKEMELIEGVKIGGTASLHYYAEDADIVLAWS